MKRFLVTTALEETWRDDEPVLFLGEWCRLFSRQKRWSGMDAETLPYHWSDLNEYHADYQYLSVFYERLLEHLSRQLNQIHGVDHTSRYWRILVGPWLAYFIQILFDRWCSIQQAISCYGLSGTTILTGREDAMVPNEMEHLSRLMLSDEWNHHIFGVIIEKFTDIHCSKKNYYDNAKLIDASADEPRKVDLGHKLAAGYSKMASCFVKEQDVFFIGTYLPLFDEMKLYLRFGQVPQLWRTIPPVRAAVDWRQREWTMTLQANSDFESCALTLIPKQIPTLYLEGYKQLLGQYRELSWPKHPKLLFSSCVLWHDTVSMAYMAEKAGQGTPLVYGQHGGVYGVAKFTWAEEHEVAISDRYITWGWSDQLRPSITSVGILKINNTRESGANLKHGLLLVTWDGGRYSYRLSSELFPISADYYDQLFVFAGSLPDTIQKYLLVRATSQEQGWYQPLRWRDRYPEIKLDLGISRMRDLLNDARLVVYTYNSTGYLEAMASNIPTIIFWDPLTSPLRDSATPYFEELKRVGIFHESPESAAKHVADIWDDVDTWWSGEEVQAAREYFCRRYAYLPNDMLGRVEAVLRDAMLGGHAGV